MDDKKTHGVEATNQEYARYDQVRKDQRYHLSDAADSGDAYDDEYRIRTVDLGRFLKGDAADRRAFARDLGEALRGIGFAILEGHGVDASLYDEAAERVEEFYAAIPLEEKLRFRAARHGSINQGYFPIRETSDIHPDLVEGWVFCRRAFAIDAGRPVRLEDYWPRPEMEPFFRRLCLEHEALIRPIMQSLLMDLGCDAHLYDRRLTATNFGLRLNYYPPLTGEDEASGAARILGHEDVDLFTFLPAPAIEGLQVLNRVSMKWVLLNAPRGTIILNTGDYMQRITNDILPSTTHRVVQPRDPALRSRARVSFPMAVYLWEDELLEVLPGLGEPRYEPIQAVHFHTRTTSKFYGDDYAVR
ncbi:MAG TPA: 2-oxoglutarate and iron-dependent oxygenase domain-containing protein [Candidatus Polarisedimenticolia bacterium]|nr:2-oxoglutarate and iron-dependent oxygenase domain-containing protein [Candidatus Polarisedimenticolia bacterium]